MNRVCIGIISFLITGGASIALTRQHTKPQPKPPLAHQSMPQQIIKDTSTGAAGDALYWKRFERIQLIMNEGRAALAAGNYAISEARFEQALTVQPQEPMAWLLLAEAYEKDGKENQAVTAYRQLVGAQGWGSNINTDPTTYMRFVLALSRSNQGSEAAQVYHKAAQKLAQSGHPILGLSVDIQNPDEVQIQAAAHFVLGTRQPSFGPISAEEQLKHLQTAVRLQPRWGQAQSAYADALQKMGRRQEAQTAQNKALVLGDHSSVQERMKQLADENMRQHQLRYHPDQPERYHYNNPQNRPTQAEVEAALAARKQQTP